MGKSFFYYEPKYYEQQALNFIVNKLRKSIKINFRYSDISKSYYARSEIDGIVEIDDEVYAVEIKSIYLDEQAVLQIVSKYAMLNFRKLIILAPNFFSSKLNSSLDLTTTLIKFVPDIDKIWDWYDAWSYPTGDCAIINESFETGKHSFRYILAASTRNRRVVFNQVDKKINNISRLKKDIRRLPFPPAKILWSTRQFLSPKDLFHRKSEFTILNGFSVIDIDGDRLHRDKYPCEILYGESSCTHCKLWSQLELNKIIKILDLNHVDYTEFQSGNKGYHIYIDYRFKNKVQDCLSSLKNIKYDHSVFDNQKSFVTFPNSLNANTMLALVRKR